MFADIYIGYPLPHGFTYRIPEGTNVTAGMRVRVNFSGRVVTGFVSRVFMDEPTQYEVKDIIQSIDEEPIFDKRLIDLANFVASQYLATVGEALAMALPSGKRSSRKRKPPVAGETADFRLTGEQEGIFRSVLDKYASGVRHHLIFGVTGSGKTEIYMELASHFIGLGRSVIYLVPEISISSQVYQRLHAVFGDTLILYHSRLSQGERIGNWIRFFSGDAKVAIGTRSAVFLQAPDLGMIVIDEEHDGSYKEGSTSRYNARRVAFYRSREENALLVMGSATPSMESLYAAERGVIGLHRLGARYGGARMPEIEIVAMQKGKRDAILSPILKLRTKQAIDRGEQAIYLLNRRGFSPVIMCDSCGAVVRCPNCDISLNLHGGGFLLCHYCGYRKREPEQCAMCGTDGLVRLGAGTQRIEEVIEKEFHVMRVFRMDQDSMGRKGESARMIGMMDRGEIDILLGTQMVAKGFDFHRVTLVGVLMADIGLNLPDFRSTERILSLLLQAAGRSGRGESPGLVIVQTINPENPVFDFVRRQDYLGFYAYEKKIRESLGYPPFRRLARLLVRGRDEGRVIEDMNRLKAAIDDAVRDAEVNVVVLGPSSAPLAKIGGNFRHHLLLKAKTIDELRRVIVPARERAFFANTYLEIDIDPFEIM